MHGVAARTQVLGRGLQLGAGVPGAVNENIGVGGHGLASCQAVSRRQAVHWTQRGVYLPAALCAAVGAAGGMAAVCGAMPRMPMGLARYDDCGITAAPA